MPVWKRNLLMLWISQILVMAGYDAMNPFIPLFMKNGLGLTAAASLALYVALYNIGAYIAYGISNPLWGWMGDRYGMKPMLLRGTFLTAFLWPVMGYIHSPTTLVVLRFATAFLAGTTSASQMMIARTAPLERQGFAQGVLTTAVWSGSTLGCLVGGTMIHYASYRSAFWMCGIMYFFAGISILFTEDKGTSVAKTKATAQPSGSWLRRLTANGLSAATWTVIGLYLILGVISRFDLPFVALRVEQIVGNERADYVTGIISAIVGIGSILSGICCGYLADKYPPQKLLLPVLVICGMFAVFQGVGQNVSFFAASRTLFFFAIGALGPMIQKLLTTVTPHDKRGLAFGFNSTAFCLGGIIASSLGGMIMASSGIAGIFLGTGLLALLAYPVFLFGVKYAQRKK